MMPQGPCPRGARSAIFQEVGPALVPQASQGTCIFDTAFLSLK